MALSLAIPTAPHVAGSPAAEAAAPCHCWYWPAAAEWWTLRTWPREPPASPEKVEIQWVETYGGFQLGKWGYPNCWLVFLRENLPSFETDDDWGYPYDSGNPHMEWSLSLPMPTYANVSTSTVSLIVPCGSRPMPPSGSYLHAISSAEDMMLQEGNLSRFNGLQGNFQTCDWGDFQDRAWFSGRKHLSNWELCERMCDMS